jgi:hypothetical protein
MIWQTGRIYDFADLADVVNLCVLAICIQNPGFSLTPLAKLKDHLKDVESSAETVSSYRPSPIPSETAREDAAADDVGDVTIESTSSSFYLPEDDDPIASVWQVSLCAYSITITVAHADLCLVLLDTSLQRKEDERIVKN